MPFLPILKLAISPAPLTQPQPDRPDPVTLARVLHLSKYYLQQHGSVLLLFWALSVLLSLCMYYVFGGFFLGSSLIMLLPRLMLTTLGYLLIYSWYAHLSPSQQSATGVPSYLQLLRESTKLFKPYLILALISLLVAAICILPGFIWFVMGILKQGYSGDSIWDFVLVSLSPEYFSPALLVLILGFIVLLFFKVATLYALPLVGLQAFRPLQAMRASWLMVRQSALLHVYMMLVFILLFGLFALLSIVYKEESVWLYSLFSPLLHLVGAASFRLLSDRALLLSERLPGGSDEYADVLDSDP